MDRQGLREALIEKLRLPAGDGTLTPPVLNGTINEALRRYSAEREWPWLLTSATVAISTSGIGTLPTGFVTAKQLLMPDSNGTPNVVPYVGIDNLLSSEYRYCWADDGTNVRVEPAPVASTNSTLWYFRVETDLTADTDTPLMPAAYHDLIVTLAAELGAKKKRDYEQAQMLHSEYLELLKVYERRVFRKAPGGIRVGLRRERSQAQARWS